MPTLITDAFDVLMLRCQAERFRPASIEAYRWRVQPFIKWCNAQGITELESLTPHCIRTYLVSIQTIYRGTDKERPASGSTLHGVASNLRAFFNFCVADGMISTSPMKGVKMPRKPKKVLEALELRDVQRLVEAAGTARNKAVIYFLLDTGVRAAECLGITIGDVDRENRSVHIQHGKGDKGRIVYYGEETSRRLDTYLSERPDLQPNHLLWPGVTTHKKMNPNGLSQMLTRLKLATGIKNCNPHAFRRAFALNCLRNGMDIYTLAKIMGHTDIVILRQYLALTQQDAQAAHRRYGVVDHLSA